MQYCRADRIRKAAVFALPLCILAGFAVAGFASEGGEAAHHVDTGKQMKDFFWRWVDFAILVAVLVWALKKANLAGTLRDRRSNIEKMLNEAVEAKKQAEAKMAEYQVKLENANREIDELSAAIRREGELEKERIIAEARVTADKIREQAKAAADQAVLKARAELREEAARLAVELAGKKISQNITKGDQDKLVGEYLDKVVDLQ